MRFDRTAAQTALLSAAVVATLSASLTQAAEKFWDGPVNNQWTNTSNWFGGEPGAADIAVFDGATSVERNTVVLSANRQVLHMLVVGVPQPGPYTFISEGGVLTAQNGVDIETAAGSISFENFHVNTGSLSVQSGATLNMRNNTSIFAVGFNVGGTLNWSSGSLTTGAIQSTVFGGVMNVTAGGRGLSDGSTLQIDSNGLFTSNEYFDIGSSADVGNGPTGTLGVAGGSTYQQTGGVTPFWGHNPGDSALVGIAENSTATLSSGLGIGVNGGSARVDIESGGRLHVGGPLTVGVIPSGAVGVTGGGRPNIGGQGNNHLAGTLPVINIDSGTLSTAAPASFGTGVTVNLNATIGPALLEFGDDATFFTGSTLNWSGGTWNNDAGTIIAFDGGAGSFTAPASSRELSDGSTLRITNAGTVVTNGYFDIAGLNSSSGTMLVTGPGSSFISTSPQGSLWGDQTGNSATVTFSNSGVGSFADTYVIAGRGGGAAAVNLQSSARLGMGSLEAGSNTGSSQGVAINVNSATLAVTNDAVLQRGAVVNYSAGSIGIGGRLVMRDNAQVLLTTGGNKVLRAGGLSMSGTSKIDLNDNDMIVGSLTPKADIENLVRVARNGGAWNGTVGITSTAAKSSIPKNKTLGVLSGAEYTSVGGTGAFSGQPYSSSDTLVKFTWYGDVDFNGVVDFDDYSRIDAGFNNNRTGWLNGDVDYNNIVDFDDYSLIDQAFNTQTGTLRHAMQFLEGGGQDAQGMTEPALRMVAQHFEQFGQPYANSFLAAVPEPTGLALIGGASLTMLSRRRRH